MFDSTVLSFPIEQTSEYLIDLSDLNEGPVNLTIPLKFIANSVGCKIGCIQGVYTPLF